MVCYIDGKKHVFHSGRIKADFKAEFPGCEADVERLFSTMETINTELFSGTEAPEPPYDMNLYQLIKFGIKTKIQKPTFMKYGNKNVHKVLDAFTDSEEIKSAIYSYCPYPMVFMAFAYQWGVFGDNVYPRKGMQAIADAAVVSLNQMGGVLKLNTEATEILVNHGKAYGIGTKAGDEYYGKVISNASPQYTFSWVRAEEKYMKKLRQSVAGRKVFPSICALFMAIKDSYDFGNTECIVITDSKNYRKRPEDYTEDTAPVVISIYPKREGVCRPVVAMIPLTYGYEEYWKTETDKIRGEAYRKLKKRVEDAVLSRIYSHLGDDFKNAVEYHELSTPMTFERYTYSQNGSFMGWSIEEQEYGKFMKQRTAIKDLFLVGQWVFPGFGIAGVMASGYYLAKEILKDEGIDLKKEMAGV